MLFKLQLIAVIHSCNTKSHMNIYNKIWINTNFIDEYTELTTDYFNFYNISKIDANVLIDHKLDLIAMLIDIYVIDKYNFVDFMQVVVGRD